MGKVAVPTDRLHRAPHVDRSAQQDAPMQQRTGGSTVVAGKPTLLLAWEWGRNLGHLATLDALATLFSGLAANIILAVPPWAMESPQLQRSPFPRLVAPPLRPGRRPGERVHSFAGILVAMGFADAAALELATRAWLCLFERFRVDAVVLDYAPVAQFAACVAQLPSLMVTNGFSAPPADFPLFEAVHDDADLANTHLKQRQDIDSCLAKVSRRLDATALDAASLMSYPHRWYSCLAETDPYGPRRDGMYIGALGLRPAAGRVVWPPGPRDALKVFMYLRDRLQIAATFEALSSIEARIVAVCPGSAIFARSCAGPSSQIAIYETPVDLTSLLPSADVVINYGSSGLVCQSLLAGVSQVMLPTDTEKMLVSLSVARHGAGVVASGRSPEEISYAIARIAGPRNRSEDRAQKLLAAALQINLREAAGRWLQLVKQPR